MSSNLGSFLIPYNLLVKKKQPVPFRPKFKAEGPSQCNIDKGNQHLIKMLGFISPLHSIPILPIISLISVKLGSSLHRLLYVDILQLRNHTTGGIAIFRLKSYHCHNGNKKWQKMLPRRWESYLTCSCKSCSSNQASSFFLSWKDPASSRYDSRHSS